MLPREVRFWSTYLADLLAQTLLPIPQSLANPRQLFQVLLDFSQRCSSSCRESGEAIKVVNVASWRVEGFPLFHYFVNLFCQPAHQLNDWLDPFKLWFRVGPPESLRRIVVFLQNLDKQFVRNAERQETHISGHAVVYIIEDCFV
jgi:hypothetical protein